MTFVNDSKTNNRAERCVKRMLSKNGNNILAAHTLYMSRPALDLILLKRCGITSELSNYFKND